MSDEGENPRAYKKRHNRELDTLFRANGYIQPQVAGSKEYDRGYVWNFEWCGTPGEPEKVAAVKALMDAGESFEVAFDDVEQGRR